MVKLLRLRSWNTNADNLDEMVSFYQNVLGASLEHSHTVGGVKVARMSLAGATIGLFDASEGARPGVPHHTFDVEGEAGAETLVKQLESTGVKVDHIRQHGDGPGYSLYVDDPSGNHIELSWDPA